MYKKALILFLISIYTFIFIPFSRVLAEEIKLPSDGDRIPPIITHQPQEESAPTGKPLVIKAVITDNTAIKEVFLYFREMGKDDYLKIEMLPKGGNVYEATIQASYVVEPRIEYYIYASDSAGNMVLRGFSFSPLVVSVAPVIDVPAPQKQVPLVVIPPQKPVVIAPATVPVQPATAERQALKTQQPSGKAWYKNWWVWAIAGGIAGGVAMAGGGGGGGGGGHPPTGSVTISAPVP